jgi:hypothetical protein
MVKKKPIRKGKKNKKPLVVAIVSLIAIIILAFLALFTSQFSGKAIEGCTLSYCQFEYTDNGQDYTINILENQIGLIDYNNSLLNINVVEANENNCKFDLIPANRSNQDNNGIVLTAGETEDGLKLLSTACETANCIESSTNHPFWSEYSYEIINGQYSKFNFEPKYVVADQKYVNKCEDKTSFDYSCENDLLQTDDNQCSEDYSCWKGSCVSCTDNYNNSDKTERGKVAFSIDGEFSHEFNDFCKDENTLIDASCNPGIKLTEITCDNGCYLDEHNVAKCLQGCVDSDDDNTEIKGNVTGLYTSEDTFEDQIVYREDTCKNTDSKVVIERTCGDDHRIVSQEITCSGANVCQNGKCTTFSALNVTLSNFNKQSSFDTSLESIGEITVPFWIVTTLKDEDGKILSYKRELFEPGESSYNSYLTYHNSNLVEKKEVIVYDVPDPSKWSVYLTNNYSHTADEPTQK